MPVADLAESVDSTRPCEPNVAAQFLLFTFQLGVPHIVPDEILGMEILLLAPIALPQLEVSLLTQLQKKWRAPEAAGAFCLRFFDQLHQCVRKIVRLLPFLFQECLSQVSPSTNRR